MPIKLLTSGINGITPKQMIDQMRKAYEDTFQKWSAEQLKSQYNDSVGISKTKSVWVSKNEINALLEENGGNGVRIYFACHTPSTSTGENQMYLGLQTVVLVATYDEKNPANPSTEDSADLVIQSDDPSTANSVTFSAMGKDTLPICPPRCSK